MECQRLSGGMSRRTLSGVETVCRVIWLGHMTTADGALLSEQDIKSIDMLEWEVKGSIRMKWWRDSTV